MSQTEDTNELDRYEVILHVVHIVFVTSSGLTSLTRCRIEPENADIHKYKKSLPWVLSIIKNILWCSLPFIGEYVCLGRVTAHALLEPLCLICRSKTTTKTSSASMSAGHSDVTGIGLRFQARRKLTAYSHLQRRTHHCSSRSTRISNRRGDLWNGSAHERSREECYEHHHRTLRLA